MDKDSEDIGLAGLIDQRIQKFVKELQSNGLMLSVADVVRLIDLRNQFASDEVREVRVTWGDIKPGPFAIST